LKRIAFVYNWVPDRLHRGLLVECASGETITAIEQALLQGGNEIISINLTSQAHLHAVIEDKRPDFAFCIAEGFLDQPGTLYNGSGAALVRRRLAQLGVPASHSSPEAMERCRNKEQTYRILQAQGVACPWHLFLEGESLPDIPQSRFPLFVKPAGGGNSIGIDRGSVVGNSRQLVRRIRAVTRSLGPVSFVAEQYLPGPEYTVGVVGNAAPVVLPAIAFGREIRTAKVKRREVGKPRIIQPREELFLQLRELALKSFFALGCADAIRVDIKADSAGNLYVIDVNGTPSLAPAASLAQMAAAAGLEHGEFLNLLLYYGLERTGIAHTAWEQVAAAEAKLDALRDHQPVVA
jgi:D-alanine-D-alanine ligase